MSRTAQQLRAADDAAWESVAYQALDGTPDPDAIEAILDRLEATEPGDAEGVVHALVGAGEAAAEPILRRLADEPLSVASQHGVLALGEMVRAALVPAERVVPALADALERQAQEGFRPAEYTVAALRECARVTALPDAADGAERAFKEALHTPGVSFWAFENLAAVLDAAGPDAKDRMERALSGVPDDDEMAAAVRAKLL